MVPWKLSKCILLKEIEAQTKIQWIFDQKTQKFAKSGITVIVVNLMSKVSRRACFIFPYCFVCFFCLSLESHLLYVNLVIGSIKKADHKLSWF